MTLKTRPVGRVAPSASKASGRGIAGWRVSGVLIALSISALLLAIGVNSSTPQYVLAALLVLLVTAFIWALLRTRDGFVFAAFLACFFVFLVSRPTVSVFFDSPASIARQTLGTNFTSETLHTDILVSLYIASVGLLVGALLVSFRKAGTTYPAVVRSDASWVGPLRQWALVLFFGALPFQILVLLEISATVSDGGFYDIRVSSSSSLPSIVHLLAGMYDVGLFAFLATRPSKRTAALPLFAYVAIGVLSLSTWQRSTFVLSIIFVILYLVHREVADPNGERWITQRFVAITALAAIPITAFMLAIGELRGRQGQPPSYPFFGLVDFLYGQGISVNVIGYAMSLEERVPHDKLYSFGPLIEFVKWNLASVVSGEAYPVGQNAVRAVEGHQFAHLISYVVMPDVYLSGSGYGSTFVAELWTDFGLFGVFFGSLALGTVLMLLPQLFKARNLVVVTVALMVVREIMFVPRASFVQYFVTPFETSNLIAGVILTLAVILTTRRSLTTQGLN